MIHTVIPQFCKPLMESIVTKGMSVREFKEQLVREVYEQGIECSLKVKRSDYSFPGLSPPLSPHRLRIRKKMWRTPGTIYLDSQVFEKDIHTFTNFEMYVECLKGGHYIIMTSLHKLTRQSDNLHKQLLALHHHDIIIVASV